MRVDPKAPADSPHHPRNVRFAGLQQHLEGLAAKAVAEAGIELPPGTRVAVDVTPLGEFEAAGQELVDTNPDMADHFEPESPVPADSATAELDAALAEAGLVEPAPTPRKRATRKRAPKAKPALDEALAAMDAEGR